MTALTIGDRVAALGLEGVLRYAGPVDFKDGEWAGIELSGDFKGKGKNDGSVNGTQYFACTPLDGIFVPLAKVSASMPPPALPALRKPQLNTPALVRTAKSSADAAQAKITAGSRAAKYLGMTAQQLAKRDVPSLDSSLGATPKPSVRPRPSFGTPTAAISQPRKSTTLGTPTPSRVAKRPSSAIGYTSRQSLSNAPSVPPLPPAYANSGRATPSMSGRVTPVTPSTARRYSAQPHRPTTPSRPSSRASNASMIGPRSSSITAANLDKLDRDRERPASALSMSSTSSIHPPLPNNDSLLSSLKSDLAASRRAEQQARLELQELQEELKDVTKRRDALEKRSLEDRARQDTLTALREEHSKTLDKVQDLESEIKYLSTRNTELESELLDAAAKSGKFETEISRLEAELGAMKAQSGVFETERAELEAQLDQLRSAGQALVGVYEEKLQGVEESRREAQEQLASYVAQVEAQIGSLTTSQDTPAAEVKESALKIENETLRLEREHLQSRLSQVEETLANTRYDFEEQLGQSKRKREATGEIRDKLEKEVRSLKEEISKSADIAATLRKENADITAALNSHRSTLENQRAELETLRADSEAYANSKTEISRLQQQNEELLEEIKLSEEIKANTSVDSDELSKLKAELAFKDAELAKLQSAKPLSAPTNQDLPLPKPTARESVVSKRSVSSSSSTAVSASSYPSHDANQIEGLKYLLAQATEENKELERVNKRLLDESTVLRESMESLEKTVEGLLSQPESSSPNSLAVLKAKDSEISALNQEVLDLEALIEAKIFREDELESELRKLRARLSSTPSVIVGDEDDKCELCGKDDHQIETCPIFGGGSLDTKKTEEPFCEDCEVYGHTIENCLSAQEVF